MDRKNQQLKQHREYPVFRDRLSPIEYSFLYRHQFIKNYIMKILFILPFFFFSIAVNAQQTEDDIYVGKSRTFGNYSGTDIRNSKPIKGLSSLGGIVVKVEWCEEDCWTIWVKKDDGIIVAVGTRDYGFSVPKEIVGKRIIIEGIKPDKLNRERKIVKKEYQKDIQFAATGIRVFN